jgi:hypothetical protein
LNRKASLLLLTATADLHIGTGITADVKNVHAGI